MSTFQAAFLNEVIYVTNARFKESKEGSLAAQRRPKGGQGSCWKIEKGLKITQLLRKKLIKKLNFTLSFAYNYIFIFIYFFNLFYK